MLPGLALARRRATLAAVLCSLALVSAALLVALVGTGGEPRGAVAGPGYAGVAILHTSSASPSAAERRTAPGVVARAAAHQP